MPYKDITYDNGFTERMYYNVTSSEEGERFKRTNRVKTFPSVNHRTTVKKSRLRDQEPPLPDK